LRSSLACASSRLACVTADSRALTPAYHCRVNADALVATLDQLDHRERLAALIAHGRKLASEQVGALCAALMRGDVHRRRLALQLAALRGDLAVIERALDDGSISVRCHAAKLFGRVAATIPASVIDRLDAASCKVLLREVIRRRRTAIAESLVEALVARERLREAVSLLVICETRTIAGWLDTVAWPDAVWMRLATHRPDLLIARIEDRFGEGRPDLVWRRFDASVWAKLGAREPASVAGWIDRHADPESLPVQLRAALPYLVRWSPSWVVGTLARRIAWVAQHGLPAGLSQRARKVDDGQLAWLGRGLARSAPHLLALLLARLPYPRRASAFASASEPLDTARIEWPTSLLAVLPTAERELEVTRMLGLVRAQTDASWRRELLGLRDIEHARAELEREGRAAQATDRAEAHMALIRSTMRSQGGMAETLAWLRARVRNEQDPVRLAVLTALAELPGQRFDDPVALDQVIAPIFDARDTSYATRGRAAQIAQRLMIARAHEPRSPMFALGLSILERLAGQAGTPDLPRLDRNLPRGAELAIVEALLPWVQAAQQRQQQHHGYRLWAALGKRAWRVPALAQLLEHMLWHGYKNNVAWTAQLWLQDPRTRDPRVRALVERDRSALYLAPVVQHCHQRRQTLLTERFTSKPPRGRFHDGKVVVIPIFVDGFQRWSSALQRQYVALLEQAEAEPKRFSQARAGLIACRARVPVVGVAALAGALASSDVSTLEAALGALVHLDDPAPALPILLDHLDGDRARVAMYAMPRLAQVLPSERMVGALAELLTRPKLKVTVHKEALRLLGQLATPRAIELVRAAWREPLHRDVRVAAMHAARSLLVHGDAWTILADAATDPDPDIARALVEVPLATVSDVYRLRYLSAMAAVADHPSPSARAALFLALTSGWSIAGPREAVELAARVIARLDALDPWRAAARVLTEGTRSSTTHVCIEALIAELAMAAERDVAPAGERDRIAHQRLVAVIDTLLGDRHPLALTLVERLAISLLAQPHAWELGAKLRLDAAPNERVGAVAAELFVAAPTAGLRRAVEAAVRSAAQLEARDWQPTEAAQALADLREGEASLLAVSLLAVFGPRWGWGLEWTAKLAELREHPDLDVRLAARAVWITNG